MRVLLVVRSQPGLVDVTIPEPKHPVQEMEILPSRGDELQYLDENSDPVRAVVLGRRFITGSDPRTNYCEIHISDRL